MQTIMINGVQVKFYTDKRTMRDIEDELTSVNRARVYAGLKPLEKLNKRKEHLGETNKKDQFSQSEKPVF